MVSYAWMRGRRVMLFLVDWRNGEAMRRRIEKAARGTPGITKNAVAKKLGVHWNAIRHHVEVLEKQGRIHVDKTGWSHELFSPEVPAMQRRLVSALRHPDRSKLLDAVLAHPEIGTYQLSSELDWSRKKVLSHLAHLQKDGLVERIGSARPRYRPAELPEDLDSLFASLGHGETDTLETA